MILVTSTPTIERGCWRLPQAPLGAGWLNFLVVPALNQQGGDDPFDLRGGQDAFEGGREALFI